MAAHMRAVAAKMDIGLHFFSVEVWIQIATSRPGALYKLVRVHRWMAQIMKQENVAFSVAFSFIQRETLGTKWPQFYPSPMGQLEIVGGFVGTRLHGIVLEYDNDDASSGVIKIQKVGFYDATQPLAETGFHTYPYASGPAEGQLANIGEIPSSWTFEKSSGCVYERLGRPLEPARRFDEGRWDVMPGYVSAWKRNSVPVRRFDAVGYREEPGYVITWQRDDLLSHVLCVPSHEGIQVSRFDLNGSDKKYCVNIIGYNGRYFVEGERERGQISVSRFPQNRNWILKCADVDRLIDIWRALIEFKMWI